MERQDAIDAVKDMFSAYEHSSVKLGFSGGIG